MRLRVRSGNPVVVSRAAATTASAGIVISEKLTVTDPNGAHKSERTVMLQGNKEKVIRPDRQLIFDLDAGKIVVLALRPRATQKCRFRQGTRIVPAWRWRTKECSSVMKSPRGRQSSRIRLPELRGHSRCWPDQG